MPCWTRAASTPDGSDPVRCGQATAEDCAIIHRARELDGHRERGQWRADCPICHAERALEWDAPGASVRWRIFCPCERDTVRKALAELLPGCLPVRGKDKVPLRHDDLATLALDMSLPAMTLRLRLLQMAGMGTQAALGKLGVRRENRSRVIAGRTGHASPGCKPAGRNRHPRG